MALSDRERKEKELELLMLEQEQYQLEKSRRGNRSQEDVQEWLDKSKQDKETTWAELGEDVGVSAVQGATLGFGDEAFGAIASAYKKATGDDRSLEELYKEYRDMARGQIKETRERSPFMSFMIEAGASIPTGGPIAKVASKVPVLGKYAPKLTSTAIESAGIGVGESEGREGSDAIKSTIMGLGTHVAGKGIKKIAKTPFEEPMNIRSRFLGAGPKEFKRFSRFGDPDVATQNLKDMGLFRFKDAKFELDKNGSGRFVKSKHSSESALDLPTRRDSLRSIRRAQKQINNRKNQLFKNEMTRVPDIFELYSLAEHKYLKGKNKSLYSDEFVKELRKEFENLTRRFKGKAPTMKQLDSFKSELQSKADKIYTSPDISPEFQTRMEAQAELADTLKEYLDHTMPPEYQELNRVATDLYLMEKPLHAKIASDMSGGARELEGAVTPYASAPYWATKATEVAGGGEYGMLLRANTGEKASDIYSKTSAWSEPLLEGVQRPVKTILPRMLMRDDKQTGRSPQSTNIPTELVRMPIPRTTEEVIANKDAILLKVAQQAPESYDQFVELFEHNEDSIQDVLPVLSQMVPHLFSKDKYNRIDGIILDPAKKEMARQDLMKNDGLSNTEKMLMMNKLNKTGEFDL